MKHTNLRTFLHAIQQLARPFPPSYFLIAKDPCERKEAETALLKTLLSGQKREEALQLFDGAEDRISSILDTLTSKSFFTDIKVVCIRNSDQLDKQATSQLETYLDNPSPFSLLILSAAAINRATKLYKKGEKIALMLDLEEEKPWQREASLATAVSEWIHSSGKSIDSASAKFFIQHCGTDRSALKSEVEKLLCYIGEKHSITPDEIRAICTKGGNADSWKLGDAVFEKNGAAALKISHALLREGHAVFALLRQLRSQFQSKLQISALLASGGGPQEIQQKFPYMRGQILQQNIQAARLYGTTSLKKAILLIDAAELQAKNSGEDPEQLLQQLLIKLSGTI